MGTQTQRRSRIENPLKGKQERKKKWQPYKGVWNSLLQGLSFFDTLYPSFLPPPLPPLTFSPIWLRLFSNLGDSNFLPAMMQQTGTLPSRTLWGSFKSVFFCHENPTAGIVAAFGFYPYRKGEDERFKTFVFRALGRGLQLRAYSGSTMKEICKHQRCFSSAEVANKGYYRLHHKFPLHHHLL